MAGKRRRGYAAHLNRADVDWQAIHQKVLDYAAAVETAQRVIETVIYPQWGRLLIAPAREAADWRGEPPAPPNTPAPPIVFDPDVLEGLASERIDLSEMIDAGALDSLLADLAREPSDLFNR